MYRHLITGYANRLRNKVLTCSKIRWPKLIALLAPAACIQNSSPEYRMVLCGDSTMAPYASSGGIVGWGEALPQFLGNEVELINLGTPAATAQSFLRERTVDILRASADVAIIQFGQNQNDSVAEAVALDSLVALFRSFGTRVILVTPFTGPNMDLLHPNLDLGVRQAAARLECPLIPLDSLSKAAWNSAGPDSMAVFFADFIHLTGIGASRIAEMVSKPLLKLEPRFRP